MDYTMEHSESHISRSTASANARFDMNMFQLVEAIFIGKNCNLRRLEHRNGQLNGWVTELAAYVGCLFKQL